MTLQHVIKLNDQVHVIERATEVAMVLNSGRNFAVAYLNSKKMIRKNCLTGRFISVKIK